MVAKIEVILFKVTLFLKAGNETVSLLTKHLSTEHHFRTSIQLYHLYQLCLKYSIQRWRQPRAAPGPTSVFQILCTGQLGFLLDSDSVRILTFS